MERLLTDTLHHHSNQYQYHHLYQNPQHSIPFAAGKLSNTFGFPAYHSITFLHYISFSYFFCFCFFFFFGFTTLIFN